MSVVCTPVGFTMDTALRATVLRMVHEIACSKHKDWSTRPYVDGLESVGPDVFSPEALARDMHPEVRKVEVSAETWPCEHRKKAI
eukprot:37111-Eustigmatos_ZCMA.PRE.1